MSRRAALPSTAQLLQAGGDERIVSKDASRLNKYGYGPVPDGGRSEFGSSTASTISEPAYQAAEQLRACLLKRHRLEPASASYQHELLQIRQELLALCELQDIAGLDVIFAASGTDLHLIASRLFAGLAARPPLVIMMEGTETGSGVEAALGGMHFGSCSPLGLPTRQGELVSSHEGQSLVRVPIRSFNGAPRLLADVHADIERLVEQAMHAAREVLLVSLDISKTGLMAPSPAFAASLKQRWPAKVHVLVDACQFRLANETVKRYLQAGFLVAMTGSKFLGGPSFCGALLVPGATGERLRHLPLPSGLGAYCARAEWPTHWLATDGLADAANLGLLLRWRAALTELRAYRQIPEAHVRHFLKVFSTAITRRIDANPMLERLVTPPLDRGAFSPDDSWDALPTIFPFALVNPQGPRLPIPLSTEHTLAVYRALPVDMSTQGGLVGSKVAAMRCQLGQAVACGYRDGQPLNALRMCVSARLIVEATSQRGSGADAVIRRAITAVDKAAALTARLCHTTSEHIHAT